MSAVSIARLKAHLSRYVRLARRGHPVTVMNRDVPVARLVPLDEAHGALSLRPPKPGAPPPGEVRIPTGATWGQDIVSLLLEERQGER